MSLNKFLISVSTAAMLASTAFADGGPVPEPPPPPPPPPEEEPAAPPPPPPAPSAYDWTGVYLGVQIGYAWGDAEHTFDIQTPGDSDPDGILGGFHIGYQTQGGAWVYGIEGDFDYTDVDGDFNNPGELGSSGSTDINYQGTLRFRLGHAADRLLVYATGGAAFADVDYGGGFSNSLCCGFTKTTFGWTVGGGGEYAFTDALSGRVEYRYTDYGPERDALRPDLDNIDMTVDMSLHTVYAGLSYHF